MFCYAWWLFCFDCFALTGAVRYIANQNQPLSANYGSADEKPDAALPDPVRFFTTDTLRAATEKLESLTGSGWSILDRNVFGDENGSPISVTTIDAYK